MAEIQKSEMAGSADSSNTLGNEDSPEQIKHYEDLVADELGRVHDTYLVLWEGILNRPDPLVIFNQVDLRNDLTNQIKSKRLLTLKRQVQSFSNALITQTTSEKPVPKLKRVLKIVAKLDVTLGKIKFAIACINPGLDPSEVRHDHEYKNVKQAMSCRLALTTYVVSGLVCDLLANSRRLIQESGHLFNTFHTKRTELLSIAENCSDGIEVALIFMNKSELNLIQDALETNIDKIDRSLVQFLIFLHSQPPLSEEERILIGRDPSIREDSLSKSTVSIMVILKLSRLLLSKIFKLSTDKQNFQMISNLSSREFDLFINLITNYSETIQRFVNLLTGNVEEDQFDDVSIMQKSLAYTATISQVILDMVEHIFVPHNLTIDQASFKLYYKAAFYQWNSAHQAVTCMFSRALGYAAF
ncbi:hypothetical protein MJO28_017338 [Puccinia striiformis f. sp. tritici]|nr:hypothetical protein MJO28_017338 [Puccinia striiformis f. sp. tritici]